MRSVRGAALAVATLLVASCSLGPASPTYYQPTSTVVLPDPPVTTGAAEPCTAEQVDVVLEGLDAAMGQQRWGTLRAMNRSEAPCTLEGSPGLLVEQGGRLLDVSVVYGLIAGVSKSPEGTGPVRLEQQQSATATVYWRGYGTAADQTTSQTVRATLEDGNVLDVALGAYATDPVFDLVDGGEATISPWVATGYGPSGYDGPDSPVEATTPCESSDLVAGVEDVPSRSGAEGDEPAVSLWIAHVGLVPCLVGGLVLASEGAEVVLDEGQSLAVLVPGGALDRRMALAEFERVRASRGAWQVRAGRAVARVVMTEIR
ncbi:DUF4232 domain-containing protein [Actinotalea sp. K2]|uniref:DUF4232 domain-containing protein n=1 Tax=Actinotalea sp. K2 TaxID=2939438 RepID=UPI002016B127|nr:DUF4232 domain-containing protein [Actinotalea sp. K2]MCL3860807.1 DUF4232 domain-containing protein [Actinotalea sp. K2]